MILQTEQYYLGAEVKRLTSVFTSLSAGVELRPLGVDPGNYWEEIGDEAGDVALDDNVVPENDGVVRDCDMVRLASN